MALVPLLQSKTGAFKTTQLDQRTLQAYVRRASHDGKRETLPGTAGTTAAITGTLMVNAYTGRGSGATVGVGHPITPADQLYVGGACIGDRFAYAHDVATTLSRLELAVFPGVTRQARDPTALAGTGLAGRGAQRRTVGKVA